MKTCELAGCDKPLGLGNARFCCYDHFNVNRTVNSFVMVEKCKDCDSKMIDSDYHQEFQNSACSRFCKVCRSKKKDERVAEKKLARWFFAVMFNSMASCGYIKF